MINGASIDGVQDLQYTVRREVKTWFGLGNKTEELHSGPIHVEGELSLSGFAYEQLRDGEQEGSVVDSQPMEWLITYSTTDGQTKYDILEGVLITEERIIMGEEQQETFKLPFKARNYRFNKSL